MGDGKRSNGEMEIWSSGGMAQRQSLKYGNFSKSMSAIITTSIIKEEKNE